MTNIKSNTKRIIALALSLLMIVTAFTACGKKDTPTANPDVSNTSSSTTEGVESVPSIDDGEETATADAGKENETTTANAGNKNNDKTPAGKPASNSSGKPESTTRPAKKPSTSKPAQKPVETTTRPNGNNSSSAKPDESKPVETTTKPSSSTPSGNTYAYFRASTGEKIKYCTYSTLDDSRCTGISESNGKVTAKYDNGTSNEWFKCDNCGKYLCEGCVEWDGKCSYCGRTDCMRFSNGGNCYLCGKYVKADTCHYCPNNK